jgi:hypothetical protein
MTKMRKVDIDKKIDFIGIGAQKSATSWITKCLSVHPEVFVADCKETHFFSDNEKYSRGINHYHEYFIDSNSSHFIGEYSTSYLASHQAAERIKLYSSDIKLIVCLRNPVDRAFSHYLHLTFKSENKIVDSGSLRNAIKTQSDIIENGMYGKHLSHYFKLFPANNILVLLYEDIQKDPRDFIQRVYNFIGVDNRFTPNFLNVRYNTSDARSSVYFKKVNKIYFSLKKNALGRSLVKYLRRTGVNALMVDSTLSRIKTNQTNISKSDRDFIYDIYRDDIYQLSGLLGIDLSNWQNK